MQWHADGTRTHLGHFCSHERRGDMCSRRDGDDRALHGVQGCVQLLLAARPVPRASEIPKQQQTSRERPRPHVLSAQACRLDRGCGHSYRRGRRSSHDSVVHEKRLPIAASCRALWHGTKQTRGLQGQLHLELDNEPACNPHPAVCQRGSGSFCLKRPALCKVCDVSPLSDE